LSTSARAVAVESQSPPLTAIGVKRWVKRALDIVLASGAIVLLAPLLVAVSIAIKLDSPGRVIFRQRRSGFNGVQFVIFKFRTMTVLEDGPSITQVRQDDYRVTRLGRLLRRTSIDELPQLFNVLKGDMSLVGPRPHALAHDNEYHALIAKYIFRYHVKPGITGWAQVNGLRGETRCLEQMAQRVSYDLWYINNWSLGLDSYILLRTCFEVIQLRAY
jgi:exopolysaccharide biosynthesis polyprenyl glycosylphosphotransferase